MQPQQPVTSLSLSFPIHKVERVTQEDGGQRVQGAGSWAELVIAKPGTDLGATVTHTVSASLDGVLASLKLIHLLHSINSSLLSRPTVKQMSQCI